ncbi:S-layer homology domain-containing protein [Planococcus lenghuensis]|uniref:S-layer protein n=1 Tax=Planococcus lenghuensis TaxID=2213202 RepID=A0A1Q2L2G3_9BACL|nr:S-layer homology domain-containing protein [Planococcus lenghuensis]AQQ54247.1 S-layer protein [Planococcus lenghuensis]
MKKMLCAAIIASLIFSLIFPQNSNAADDLTGHKYEEAMREMIALGAITGYPDGSYGPDREVSRAQFAKMIVKAFELGGSGEAGLPAGDSTEESTFRDVSADAWYAKPIAAAVDAGIVRGYPDNTFRPNALITREQMASMISRGLEAKGIVVNIAEIAPLTYVDTASIAKYHAEDARILGHLKIMEGNLVGEFQPKADSKRWMVALVLLRGREVIYPPAPLPYQASAITNGQTEAVKQFGTFEEAKQFAKADASAEVVEHSSQIVWMENGVAVSSAFSYVYPSASLQWSSGQLGGQYRPYIPTGTEMKYIDAEAGYARVELAGKPGYVKSNTIMLIPYEMMKGRSYYEVANGGLIHRPFNHLSEKYSSTGVIGTAPAGLVPGTKYYSQDGAVFFNASGAKVVEAHQYFNKLPLSSATNYTAEELDKYLTDKFPYYGKAIYGKTWTESPLAGSGQFFKDIEAQYKVNALYLLSHAIHESNWGTSKIAQDKNNLFGYGAVDGDAYNGAYTYATFKESIEDAAKKINANYHKVTGSFYNGSILGNKAIGMNVRYASDPYWGEKIAGHMYRTDLYLGKKDIYKHQLGYTNVEGLNFRTIAGATAPDTVMYKLFHTNVPVIIKGQATVNGATWFHVQSEDKAFDDAHVYGNGAYGEFVKALPLAK